VRASSILLLDESTNELVFEAVGRPDTWRAAVGAPCPDDRRLAAAIAARGHLGSVPVAALN